MRLNVPSLVGLSAPAANVNPAARKLSGAEHRAEQTQSTGAPSVRPNIEVVPSRVLCGVRCSSSQLASHFCFCHKASFITLQFTVLSVWKSSTELFILLKNEAADSDAEVEFAGENQELRVRPVRWNERILCINAPGEQKTKK